VQFHRIETVARVPAERAQDCRLNGTAIT